VGASDVGWAAEAPCLPIGASRRAKFDQVIGVALSLPFLALAVSPNVVELLESGCSITSGRVFDELIPGSIADASEALDPACSAGEKRFAASGACPRNTQPMIPGSGLPLPRLDLQI